MPDTSPVEAQAAAPPASPEPPVGALEERIACLEVVIRSLMRYGPVAALLQQLVRRDPTLRAAVLRLRPSDR